MPVDLERIRRNLYNRPLSEEEREEIRRLTDPTLTQELLDGAKQLFYGFSEGFSGWDFNFEDPHSMAQRITRQVGSLGGFLGIIIPGVTVGKVASQGLAKASFMANKLLSAPKLGASLWKAGEGVSRIRSIPLLVGEYGVKGVETLAGKTQAGRLASEFLKGKPMLSQALEEGSKLGIASAYPDIIKGDVEESVGSFSIGMVTGGLFTGVGNIPMLRQNTSAHAFAKSFAGAFTQTAIPQIYSLYKNGQLNFNPEQLVYDATLGAIFGYRSVDAPTYHASRLLWDLSSKGLSRMQIAAISTRPELEALRVSNPQAADRAITLAEENFRTRTAASIIARAANIAWGDRITPTGAIAEDIPKLTAGDRVWIEGGKKNERWKVESINEDTGEVSLISPGGRYRKSAPIEKLNLDTEIRIDKATPERIRDVERIDFEADYRMVENPIARFMTRIVIDSETGKPTTPGMTREQLLGHTLNVQEEINRVLNDSAGDPLARPWETIKSRLRRMIEPVFRKRGKSTVPLSDEDFGPIAEFYSEVLASKSSDLRSWDTKQMKFVPYQRSEVYGALIDPDGMRNPAMQIASMIDGISSGRTDVPTLRTGTIHTVIGTPERGDWHILKENTIFEIPETQYGSVALELSKEGKAIFSGIGDKTKVMFVDLAADSQLKMIRAGLNLHFRRHPELQQEYGRLMAVNARRMGIPSELWEKTVLNNLYIWKKLNSDLSLDVLLGGIGMGTPPEKYTKDLSMMGLRPDEIDKLWKLGENTEEIYRVVESHFADVFIKPDMRRKLDKLDPDSRQFHEEQIIAQGFRMMYPEKLGGAPDSKFEADHTHALAWGIEQGTNDIIKAYQEAIKDLGDVGKVGDFIRDPINFNKRMQVVFQKFVPVADEVFIGADIPREIVYVNDPSKLKIEGVDTSVLADGVVLLPSHIYDAFARSFGMSTKTGAIKGFFRSTDPVGGLTLWKPAFFRATDEMSKAMGSTILAYKSAAKMTGARKVYDIDWKDGALVFNEPPVKYPWKPSDFAMSTSVGDNVDVKLNSPITLARQVMGNINDAVASRDLQGYIFSWTHGTQRSVDLMNAYKENPSRENLDNMLNVLYELPKKDLLKLASRDERVFAALNERIMKSEREDSLDDTISEGLTFEDLRFDQGVARFINAGLDDLGVAFSKMGGDHIKNAWKNFFIKGIIQPKVLHAGLAVLYPWDPISIRSGRYRDQLLKDEEFMLGRGYKDLRVLGVEVSEVKLFDLWNDAISRYGTPDGKLKGRDEVAETEKLSYDKYVDALTAVIPRVPMDSPSGAAALRFAGFLDVDGGVLRVNSRIMKRLGGADHDGDKAFFYFGMPKSVKEYYRKSASQYDEMIKRSRQDEFKGTLDADLVVDAKDPRSRMGMFDPFTRLMVNRNTAIGRTLNLGSAVFNAERLFMFQTAMATHLDRFRDNEVHAIGDDATVQRMGDILRYRKKVRAFEGEGYITIDMSSDPIDLIAAKHDAINMAADSGKYAEGMVGRDVMNAIVLSRSLKRIHFRGVWEEELADGTVKTHINDHTIFDGKSWSELSGMERLALRAWWGLDGPISVWHNGRMVARDIMRASAVQATPDTFGIKASKKSSWETLPLREVELRTGRDVFRMRSAEDLDRLMVSKNNSSWSTHLGTYAKVRNHVFGKDRMANDTWSVNDMVEELRRRVSNDPLWDSIYLGRLAREVKGMHVVQDFLGYSELTGKYSGGLPSFAPYNAIIRKYPWIEEMLGNANLRIGWQTLDQHMKLLNSRFGGLPDTDYWQRVMAYTKRGADSLDSYIRDRVRIYNAKEIESAPESEQPSILERLTGEYIADLPSSQNIRYGSGRLRYIRDEIDMVNDFISTRYADVASITRMIDTHMDLGLTPEQSERSMEILKPIFEDVRIMKDNWSKAWRERGHNPDAIVGSTRDIDAKWAALLSKIEVIARDNNLDPYALRQFADALFIGSLNHTAIDPSSGMEIWKTREVTIGFRYATDESIRKYAKSYNQAFRLSREGLSTDQVEEMWGLVAKTVHETSPVNIIDQAIHFEKFTFPTEKVALDVQEVDLARQIAAGISKIDAFREDPRKFIAAVRSIYGVSDLGQMSIQEVRGMNEWLKVISNGGPAFIRQMLGWIKEPDRYRKPSFWDFAKFPSTINDQVLAAQMLVLYEKGYGPLGEVDPMQVRPLDYITDEGRLTQVFAHAAAPISTIGIIGNNYNTKNTRIRAAEESVNAMMEEHFGPLLREVKDTRTGEDQSGKLFDYAWIHRELGGMLRDRRRGQEVNSRGYDFLREAHGRMKNEWKDVLASRYRLSGRTGEYSGEQVVRMYLDSFSKVMAGGYLYANPQQFDVAFKLNAKGEYDHIATFRALESRFLNTKESFQVPLDIIRGLYWANEVVNDRYMMSRTDEYFPKFSMKDIFSFDTPSLRPFKKEAGKRGYLGPDGFGRLEADLEAARGRGLLIGDPRKLDEFERFMVAYLKGKKFDDTHFTKLIFRRDRINMYKTEQDFSAGRISREQYAEDYLLWQYPLQRIGYIEGYMPHADFPRKATEAWGKREIKNLQKVNPNDANVGTASVLGSMVNKVLNDQIIVDDGSNSHVAESLVRRQSKSGLELMLGAGDPANTMERTAWIPTYTRSMASIYSYLRRTEASKFNMFSMMMSKNTIRAFERRFSPLEAEGKVPKGYTDAWSLFYRLYAHRASDYPTLFSPEVLDDPNLQIKSTPYWFFSDHAALVNVKGTRMRKFYIALRRANKLTEMDRAVLEAKLGRVPTVEEIKVAEEEKFNKFLEFEIRDGDYTPQTKENLKAGSRLLQKFSQLEARYELASLLWHTKTAIGNIYGGSLLDISWNGLRNFIDARDIRVWQAIADKKRDGVEFKEMSDVKRWISGTGIVRVQLEQEAGMARQFTDPRAKKFLGEWLDRLKADPDLSDKELYQLGEKYGYERRWVDVAGYFMRKSERYLRTNAALSGYLAARKTMAELDLPLDTPYLLDQAVKSIQLTQFMYDAPNRPMFSSTNLGRIYTRFKLWSWSSVKFQREVYNQAKIHGFDPFSQEGQRLQRMLQANAFALMVGSLFSYTLFDMALPQPIGWMQDLSQYFFGDESDRENVFFGRTSLILKHPYSIFNELLPPISRFPRAGYELFEYMFNPDIEYVTQYTLFSSVPFGRMTRDVLRAIENPAMATDWIVGVPLHKAQSYMNSWKRRRRMYGW